MGECKLPDQSVSSEEAERSNGLRYFHPSLAKSCCKQHKHKRAVEVARLLMPELLQL